MTDHELVLRHLANNQAAMFQLMRVLVATLPALDGSIDSLIKEYSRVHKEIQAEYMNSIENGEQ